MSDLQSFWAAEAWRRVVENRRRRNRTRRLLLVAGSLSLGALLVFGFARGDRLTRTAPFVVHGIEVTNNRTTDTASVVALLGIRPGDPWWELAPAEIERRVAEHPRIARLDLRYAWFHRLGVDVIERVPALAVVGPPSGELTSDGWFLPGERTARSAREADLPILRPCAGAFVEGGGLAGPRASALARLVQRIRASRPALWREISEIELHPREARAYLRTSRAVILFEPGRYEELWDQVPTALQDLRRLACDDVVLDLRFAGRIVARFAEGSGPDSVSAREPYEKV